MWATALLSESPKNMKREHIQKAFEVSDRLGVPPENMQDLLWERKIYAFKTNCRCLKNG
jgi:hypothetical protein